MAKKAKYYVVWEGARPGVYDSWEKALAQVSGYPQAKYKSFASLAEAKLAFGMPYSVFIVKREKEKHPQPRSDAKPVVPSISVDAACSGNPGVMEYQGVLTGSGERIFYQGPFQQGTNNIGEFLAIVHALALLGQRGDGKTPIYTDSRTALSWVRKRKANTKLTQERKNALLFDLIKRAENWLKNNTYENPLLKWETKVWGEIPADFGRK